MKKININLLLAIAGGVVGILVIVFLVWWNTKKIEIVNSSQGQDMYSVQAKDVSNITGLECSNYSRRPIAVMIAGDLMDRPLSGIGQADIVFELPVTPNGITRFMGVFQCQTPPEIGSVRSARNEFIPLAAGIGAILTHWGGEHEALAKLDSGIINNVDAMRYEGTTFYRKRGLKPPHNGFTDIDKITAKAAELKYDLKNNFTGYPHQKSGDNSKNLSNIATEINIYQPPFDVKWTYNEGQNLYQRARAENPEIDKGSNNQIQASVVAVIETKSKVINNLYISTDITGGGIARIYQNGIVINGTWKKDPSDIASKLYFYDSDGKEIQFAPGKIWVEVTINN